MRLEKMLFQMFGEPVGSEIKGEDFETVYSVQPHSSIVD